MLTTVSVPEQFAPIFEKAQEYVSKFFEKRKFNPERGTIEIFNQRYMLVRSSAMSVEFFEMVKNLYKDGGEEQAISVARSLLFDIAHAMGYADAQNFSHRMNLRDPIEKLSAGPIHFAHAGWAYVDIFPESNPTPDENYYLIYDHPYSFESDAWLAAGKKADFPVCIMNAGYSSGWCKASFGVSLVATEIACRAKGDEHCRFIMAPPERIEQRVQAYLKKRPDIGKKVRNYEIPGFFVRKKVEAELVAREEQYRGIFESSTDTILIIDHHGKIIQANPAAVSLFERSQNELMNSTMDELIAGEELFHRLKSEVDQKGLFQSETWGYSPQHRRFELDVRGSRFRYQKNEHYLAVIRDVTERNYVHRELERLNHELEQRVSERTSELERANIELHRLNTELMDARDQAVNANKAKSTFLANMSHELRTPLNAIIGYSELIREETIEGSERLRERDLDNIRASAQHLLTLINDILDVSKIEAGRMELFIDTFSGSDLIREVIATAKPLATKNLNRLDFSVDASVGDITADRIKLSQVLLNLLSNACKFTHNGKVKLSARCVKENDKEWFIAEIHDTGIGISSQRQSELFRPFRQLDESTTRKYGGTGLGLTISLAFCEMMGGTLTARSRIGVGSTFKAKIPVKVSKKPTEEISNFQSTFEDKPSTAETPSILVIDDDPATRDIMERYLSRDGYQIATARGGLEGLQKAKNLRPSIITLDVMMQGMDGWSTLSAIKSDPELADIPVIMITMVNDQSTGYSLGAADYLVKPIDPSRLLNVLRNITKGLEEDIHVLVVEDEEMTRSMVCRTIARHGWHPEQAKNGIEALQLLDKRTPQAIVLDLMMPEMDGFQLIETIRTKSEWNRIPVIIMTAMDLSEEDRRRLNGSVVRIIGKGTYSIKDLMTEVRKTIERMNIGVR